jgi:hypothetical protein
MASDTTKINVYISEERIPSEEEVRQAACRAMLHSSSFVNSASWPLPIQNELILKSKPYRQTEELPGRVMRQSQGRYLHRIYADIYVLSGIRTHVASV